MTGANSFKLFSVRSPAKSNPEMVPGFPPAMGETPPVREAAARDKPEWPEMALANEESPLG